MTWNSFPLASRNSPGSQSRWVTSNRSLFRASFGAAGGPITSETALTRLSRHFLGRDYPSRDSPLVTVHVAIDRWFGWSGGRPLQY